MAVIKDLTRRAVETLYVEAMLLADDTRSEIESARTRGLGLTSIDRTYMAVEELRITSRLMHVLAWLMTRRAVSAGEIDETSARHESRSLGKMPDSDLVLVERLPDGVRLVIHASMDLANRARALERALVTDATPGQGPANDLIDTLRQRLAA